LSASPPIADIIGLIRHVGKVPIPEIQPVHVLAAIDMCQSYIGLFGAV
jgi:hypothetical protein